MAYTLKTTGIATNLTFCVGVDEDDTIKDFTGKTITLDTDVSASVASATWATVSRKYFVTTRRGSPASDFHYWGVRFSVTRPTLPANGTNGCAVFIATAGTSTPTGPAPQVWINSDLNDTNGIRGGRVTSTGKFQFSFNSASTGSIGSTTLPTDNSTKYSVGGNYKYNSNVQVFYGADGSSLAADSTAAADNNAGDAVFDVYGIGGCDGNNARPAKLFIVCGFNKQLSLSEFQSLHNDWFGTLFDAASGDVTTSISGSAATPGSGTASPAFSIEL